MLVPTGYIEGISISGDGHRYPVDVRDLGTGYPLSLFQVTRGVFSN
jgi:hypothetical protein